MGPSDLFSSPHKYTYNGHHSTARQADIEVGNSLGGEGSSSPPLP